MDHCQTNQGCHIKLVLTDEELQLPALYDVIEKYKQWLRLSESTGRARKTRSATSQADQIYDEIMAFKLPPIKLNVPTRTTEPLKNSPKPKKSGPASPSPATPSTPLGHRLRAHLKKKPNSVTSDSGSSASGSSSNVLVAALNQQHPSVSVTKIRQLLRADSAQKKREQERERQERIRLERKAKEERAECQKKQLLEERAITAKQKREQRLQHAAEVRKAREQAKQQKITKPVEPEPQAQPEHHPQHKPEPQVVKPAPPPKKPETPVLNETFKKNDIDNIEIVIHDTSNSVIKGEVPPVATWARAPHLRPALVEQFSNPDRRPTVKPTHLMPVDLERILGKSVGTRHLHRTSSAVWTPPRKSIRRSNSIVSTPKS